MSLIVVVQETALRALARIRAEDQEAFASIRRPLAALAEQPHPDQAVAWGGGGIYRLHLPRRPAPMIVNSSRRYLRKTVRDHENQDQIMASSRRYLPVSGHDHETVRSEGASLSS